jgi:small-conductance mechanosensitive channel
LITISFVLWANALANVSNLLLEELKDKLNTDRESKIDSDVIPFIQNLVKVGLFCVVILMALDLWGIDVTPLLASAGVLGVAIAFAAKDTVSNLFGGLSVFMDRPYRVGDYVYIDNSYRGEVIEIGMRSTKIRTRDNILITVPNSVMVTQSVINETGYDPKMRLRIPLGVAYDSDLDKVEYVLKGIAHEHEDVLNEPHPRVRFREFGDSAINLEFLVYIKFPEQKGRTTHELIKAIKSGFQEENIEIPYPQRQVHMSNGK